MGPRDSESQDDDIKKLLEDLEPSEEILEDIRESEDESEPKYSLDFELSRLNSIGRSSLDGAPEHDSDGEEIPEYNKLISESECVAGDVHCLQFLVENVGDEEFPGGEIKNISVSADWGSSEYTGSFEIPSIEPNEEKEVHCHLSILEDGHLTFFLDVVAIDEKKVKVDSHADKDNQMIFSTRAVPRESLEMLLELEKLREG